ncbi:amidase 1-like isoform X2 [Malania oleifera]|uniref:amidase 1-like isoform X2 n=1 Tax=Malania oleifera TaxID=397392 RepID=UPI0025AE9FBA|nr:amidase 1-like isoform X2 [Malania oleifera]
MSGDSSDHGAFMKKFTLHGSSAPHELPLTGLTFAVKDIFDVEGYVTGFGSPEWARTHSAATATAPVVLALLRGGATCVGKTVMDEMAYCMFGENKYYGTPTNPCVPDRVPGGSSSGSAVAVGAKLADFALGTDTGASVRVPASFCGIFGFRPSHGVVSTAGVIPMSESFDTVGWFARDPMILNKVGRVLLQLPALDPVTPSQIIIPEDCFRLLSIPSDRITQVLVKSVENLFGGHIVKHTILGEYLKDKVPSLKNFMSEGNDSEEYNVPSLVALSSAMRLLQRVRPDLGPGISERVWAALKTTDDNIDACHSMMAEMRAALTALLGDFGILAIPTVPKPPPKLQMDSTMLECLGVRSLSLLSIAGVSGFCQVNIPLGLYDDLPVAVSLVAKHCSDGFLLNLVETLYGTLKEQVEIAERMNC